MNTENQPIDLVSAALVECQGKLKSAHMDATNPFFKCKYATLGAIIEASRESLHAAGLAIQQTPSIIENMVSVHTVIRHKSGQFLDGGCMSMPIGENERNSDAQLAGSIMTYLKRYAWASVLGIYADEDSDGNEAPKGAVARQAAKPATFTRPTTQTTPQSQPSTTNALPVATDKHRMKALNNLAAAPGQRNRVLVTHYLMSKGWISGTQEPEAWPLEYVPATPEQMAKVAEEVTAFEGHAKDDYEHAVRENITK